MKSKRLLFMDTESTGLHPPLGTPLEKYPHMTEICMILTDLKLKPIKVLDTLIRPPVNIPDFITKITKIDDYMVRSAPSFQDVYPKINKILKKAGVLIMHNWEFDWNMIEAEAARIGKHPSKPRAFCTVEQSMHLKGQRLKLAELYQLATGADEYGAHRARNDVEATMKGFTYIVGGKKNHELAFA